MSANTAATHRTGAKRAFPTRTLVFTALSAALTVAATVVLGFRTGDFFFNCGDTVIFVTAALLGPVPAMLAGGIGSFFADLAVYPATMFFTLFIKGLEGLLCGVGMKLLRTSARGRVLAPVTGGASMLVAGAFMMTGYFICNSFIYGTPASALAALPANAVQASLSVALACALLYLMRLDTLRVRFRLSGERRLTAQPYRREERLAEDKTVSGDEN